MTVLTRFSRSEAEGRHEPLSAPFSLSVAKGERPQSPFAAQPCPFRFSRNRKRAAIRCSGLCTPGMGVSVGVQVPCRRFTLMSRKIHEDNYKSKARASP